MKKLVIVGGGGFGPEVLSVARETFHEKEFVFKGFLDDAKSVVRHGQEEFPVLSRCSDYLPEADDRFICAIGDPIQKLKVCDDLLQKGAQFINLLHPSAFVSEGASLGKGVIAFPHTFISTNTVLSDFVTLNVSTVIGHDAHVGRGSTLSPHCAVSGFVQLKEAVFMGALATVIPGKVVNAFARIGAGSVVIRDTKAKHTVFGAPAITMMEN
ncbi:MAG: NeuD/PglB/VioB family sugar acetyltransferase [Legionellaceae bacterium]|nr:NeuD/PglB/VioB family sugar acetyltransferase [Legionellaceae bacterium]